MLIYYYEEEEKEYWLKAKPNTDLTFCKEKYRTKHLVNSSGRLAGNNDEEKYYEECPSS